MKGRAYLQSGFDFDGLATTRPGAAPATFDPAAPILFKTPCRAMGPSEAMKSLREPVARSLFRMARELMIGN